MSRRPDACAPPPRIWISGRAVWSPRHRRDGATAAARRQRGRVRRRHRHRDGGVAAHRRFSACRRARSAARRSLPGRRHPGRSTRGNDLGHAATARVTSSPPNGWPSRRSTASPLPVDAPAGAIARPTTTGQMQLGLDRRAAAAVPDPAAEHLHDRRTLTAQLHRPGLAHRRQGVGGCDQEGAGQAPHPLLVRQRGHVLDRRLAVDRARNRPGSRPAARASSSGAAPSRLTRE